jgi:DNA-binding SARP family transcriptional activator/tetratricopeptide (TPR) repeat protein
VQLGTPHAGEHDRRLLEIGLLGPMRVSVDGRPLEVTGGRLRTLLALLAMAAGESVSTDRLAASLWDERLPVDVRKAVQVCVARLRAELGAEFIVTSPAGYALRAAPDQVDAMRFVRLLDAAGSAADGSAERELLVEALTLWRGAPFEGIRSSWLEASVAPQLVESYLAGTERRIDLDIADGRARELVVELAELTSRHPMRESLWVRRLVVLDRSGRPAEALAQYEAIRVQLADELGADPGAELQGVHADLLAGRAPAVRRDVGTMPVRTQLRRTVPRQLPVDVDGFTGRGAALQWLDECFDHIDDAEGLPRRPVAIAAIAGAAGIGKSALAIHAAHQLSARFPDGQLYVELQGATAGLQPLAPSEVLARFLRALGTEAATIPTELDEASAAFRSRVADRRLLVVLDNAADAAQVRPLLPAGPGCGAVVTSRAVLSGIDGARHLRLDGLAPAEATELLARLAGPARIAAEPEAAADVVQSCASLPLAVRIAGARLAARPTWPVQAMAQRLAGAQRRLDELEIDQAGARASFAVSIEQARNSADPLDRAAAEAFEILGGLDGPELSVAVVARLLDESDIAAERVLERLVDIQLLETPSPGRYHLHDLLRLYSRELAQQHPEPARSAALTRVLAFYVATAWQTLKLLRPGDYRLARTDHRWRNGGLAFGDDQAALQWLDAERANLVAAVQQAASSGSGAPDEIAMQLAHALFGFFEVRGHWDEWAQVNQTALGIARANGDLVGQGQVHNDLGVRYSRLGRYDQALACLQESLTIRRALGDLPGQAAGLVNVGLVYEWQGQDDQALVYEQESLAISRTINDPRGAAGGLANLGNVHQRQGRYDEALACLQESLAISRELGDRKGQATTLNNLGALYGRQGRYDQALHAQEEGLAIYRELGDRDGEAFCLTDIGIVHQRQGRPARSLASLQESLAIREQLQDLHGQTETLRELGVTLRDIGRIDDARGHWQQALTIFEKLPSADVDQVRVLLADLPRSGRLEPA